MTTKAKFTIEQIEAAGFDSDSAQRVRALCQHLDCEPDDLSQGYRDTMFRYRRRKVKRGTSPDEATALVHQLADALKPCVGSGAWQLGRPVSLDVLRAIGYRTLHAALETHAPETLKVGIHDVLNTLYFLSTGTDNYDQAVAHRDTLREAWRVMTGEAATITDRRTTEETDSGEYMVMTDDEADRAWDESLESLLDDGGCVEGADSHYFDRERWKKDARIDGRGHSLSGYDGNEDSETVTDDDGSEEEFFIYRTN